MGKELRNVVLVDAARTAFARGGRGALTATRLDEAGATVVRALLDRNPKVTPHMIDDIGMGLVGSVPEMGGIGATTVGRLAGLPMEIPGFQTTRQCGSSMETLQRIVGAIMVGSIDCGMSFGVERMTRQLGGGGAGRVKPNRRTEYNRKLLDQNEVQRAPDVDHDKYYSVSFPDEIMDQPPNTSMTQTGQNVCEAYGLTREQLDQVAVESHAKYGKAWDAGVYKDEIIELEVEKPIFDDDGNWVPDERGEMITLNKDEGYRAGTNLEVLSQLRTVAGIESFTGVDLMITAGNSCPTNDGFSVALVMSEEKAMELGLEPLARIVGMGVAGVKQQFMGLGPIPATHKALEHAGITADQIDRVEFNEAFAAQVIPSVADLGIPMEKVNVNGGSLAIGHPLGATGARLVGTVAREIQRSGLKYGLGTQCIGAGMGISTIVENMDA